MIAASPASTKSPISRSAKQQISTDTAAQKTAEAANDMRVPVRMRSRLPAPWFCETKSE